MLRSIYLSPVFSGEAEIEAVRRVHDPLAAMIRPHITLAFPFESSLTVGEVARLARNAAAEVAPFQVTLGPPQAQADVVWLPVLRGLGEITALHGKLYRGALAAHLNSNICYVPHVTVARTSGGPFGEVELAAGLQGPFEGLADRLIVELILPDGRSETESVVELTGI